MPKQSDILLQKNEQLESQLKEMRHQLKEKNLLLENIQPGNVDALILRKDNDLKVYTEESSDRSFRLLIERMHEGAVLINEEGMILYCNSCFADMVKLPLQKVIGSDIRTYIDLFKGPPGLPVDEKSNVLKEETVIQVSGGIKLPVMMSLTRMPLNDMDVISIIFTDLTIPNHNKEELKIRARELEKKNIELEIANKDLVNFTHISSHDLQEPLRKIQNFVACVIQENGPHLSVDGLDYLKRANETAGRMRELIDDLLLYTRTKDEDRNFEKTDLSQVIGEVKVIFDDLTVEKKAIITTSGTMEVFVIRFQFRQLFYNLISNSFKFSRNNTPTIRISTEVIPGSFVSKKNLLTAEHYCHIVYSDDGIGFEPEYNERVFDVFRRLHNGTKYPGTGMGLAICKSIIENHNGIITATGELNKGVRFDIYIPAPEIK